MKGSNEVILYQPCAALQIEVRLEDETVWLNRQQLALLFERDVKTISKHIKNALNEELADSVVVAKFATTTQHGAIADKTQTHEVEYFGLEMVTSIGYRVKSKQGVLFRQWANKVLKDYMLRGYAINQRISRIEDDVHYLKQKNNEFELIIKGSLPPHEGIFFDGQIFDAYKFVNDLIRSAKQRIILIDNYIDDSVLTMLDKRNEDVKAVVYTKNITKQLHLDLEKHNSQYRPIEVILFDKSHDRFLIIDDSVYHIGASLKDLGRKWFAFSKMEIKANKLLAISH